MMRNKWAVFAGIIATLACIWALFTWLAAPYLPSIATLKPLPVLLGLVAAIPLSVFAAIYWRRKLLVITVTAIAMLLYFGFRIH